MVDGTMDLSLAQWRKLDTPWRRNLGSPRSVINARAPPSRRGDPKAGTGHGGHRGISYQGDKTEPHITLLGPGGWLVSQ